MNDLLLVVAIAAPIVAPLVGLRWLAARKSTVYRGVAR
jgi:hypothetical protein